ncbi:MAG: serine hydrolase domain-containing protein [Ilumatobacteraceae bacterium]
MLGTDRRTVAAALTVTVLALLAACGADRLPPVAARPTNPPIVTTDEGPGRRADTADADAADPGDTADPDDTGDGGDPDQTPRPDDTGDLGDRGAPDATVPSDDTVAPTATTDDPAPETSVETISAEAWAAFDAALSTRLVGAGDQAAAVAVAVDGQIVHTADFGERVPPAPAPPASTVPGSTDAAATSIAAGGADGADGEPIEPGDRFRIASISKVITATVVLQLVEAGQIKLDDPLGDRLAAIVGTTVSDPAASAITVRQLLSHTSGFASYQGTFFGGRVDSCQSVAQQAFGTGLAAAPGTAYRYSNLNFCLLGLLVEDVAGRPYQDVVEDRLLEPLGIDGMRLAGTFDPDPAEVVHVSGAGRNYMEVLGAAGAWVATPSDLVKILGSLDPRTRGFHPLSPPMAELMRQPPPSPPSDPEHWYGLGTMAFGDGSFGHTGTVEQTHAMVLDRPDGVTWSILVSGPVPWETGDLRGVFDRSVAEAGITFG